MRSFIAITLPQEIKDSLQHIQERLKSAQADVKWVRPNNIHLTLKFLGEIKDDLIDKIKKIIAEVCKDKKALEVSLSDLGAFPHIKQPRVVWVGISQGEENIKNIATELEQKLNGIGIAKGKRAFACHITLGRLRAGIKRQELSRELEKVKNLQIQNPLKFKVNKISLFKSTLTPQGPIYEEFYNANLIAI